MSFLLDTNVICELRKGQRCHPGVAFWYAHVPDGELYLSALVLGEIRRGVESLRAKDPRQAVALERWLTGLARSFSARILPVTQAVAEEWGRLDARRRLSTIDGLLAATARVHGLTLVSRDVRGVAGTQVTLLDPFSGRAN